MALPLQKAQGYLNREPILEERARAPSLRTQKRGGRHLFSRDLLSHESKFIDPTREAKLILPEQAMESSSQHLAIESQLSSELTVLSSPKLLGLSTVQSMNRRRKSGAVEDFLYRILAMFETLKRHVRGVRARRKLTAQGEQAMDQLRYLSQLCDAAESRTPDEVIAAEGEFGAAYHEILSLSSNLAKMSETEVERHMDLYFHQMSKVLRATQ